MTAETELQGSPGWTRVRMEAVGVRTLKSRSGRSRGGASLVYPVVGGKGAYGVRGGGGPKKGQEGSNW